MNNPAKIDKIHPAKRFWRLLHIHRHEVNSIFVYAFFNGIIYLSLPLGIQAVINLIQGAQVSTSWIVLTILIIAGIAASGFFLIMQLIISENIQQKIFASSAFDFAYRLPRLNHEAVDKYVLPELVNRFFDTLTIKKGVSKILLDYSVAIMQIVFGLLLLSFYHPFFITFSVISIALIYLIYKFTAKEGLITSIKESKYKYNLVHWLEEIGRSTKTFKLAGSTELPLVKTDKITGNYLKARKAHFKILLLQFICLVGFKVILVAGFLVIGGLLVLNQQMNIGQFVAAEIIILMIVASVEKLLTGSETFYDVLTSMEKLGEISDLPLENEDGHVEENSIQPKGLALEVRDVTYQYPEAKNNTLNNINLKVSSGQNVGIAGYNGSGKTLLLDLIAGLYTEFTGSITYNDFPLSNLNIAALRGLIGYSSSENEVFEGTIYENISMGRDEISLDEVLKACEPVDLLSYVQSLPDGFDTMLLSEGKTLSQSIKLKIILARCIAKKPKLILLDDTLSQLATATRKKFLEYLLDKQRGWTVIAVSNDPEFLKMLDRVVVVDNGEVIDEGSYDELSQKTWAKDLFNFR
jgi:ABC-type bacteriocin/lantibiotic exporter with double-glycine peptidase domain